MTVSPNKAVLHKPVVVRLINTLMPVQGIFKGCSWRALLTGVI